MANMNIRMDNEIKEQAKILFNEMGMDVTTAINIFLRQSIREKRIPFEINILTPNQTTINAIEEGRKIAKNKNIKGYNNINSLMKALEE